jgi:hypothetical protein
MSLAAGWLLTPVVLGLLTCGLGLLIDAACGRSLPGALIAPVGLATLMVLEACATASPSTARLGIVVATAGAAAGLVLGRPWADLRVRGSWRAPLAMTAGVYLVFALPSLLTGQGLVTGFIKLDDSATWIGLADHALRHGRDVSGTGTGTTRQVFAEYLTGGYPLGSLLPVATVARLSGQDSANVYQPVIAVYAAIASLGLYACVRSLLGPLAAALAAGIAVQASLFFGYAQWGGIKEVATVALIGPLAALAVRAARRDGAGDLAAALVVAGGLLSTLGINGMVWAGPAVALGAGGWLLALRRRPPAATLAGLSAVTAVISIPILTTLDFARQTTEGNGGVVAGNDLANLRRAIPFAQALGLYPERDFRNVPPAETLVTVLAIAGGLMALAGVLVAVRRREWPLAAVVGLTIAGVIPAVAIGTPWIDAKALTAVAPVLVLAAAALALVVAREREEVAGVVLVALLLGATTWSTVAAAKGAWSAPRAQFSELASLGDRLSGQGPTAVLDFDSYATRHFLTGADPEGVTGARLRRITDLAGRPFPPGTVAEVDDIPARDLWAYRTLVRRRSPVASRPPAAFRRIWAGTYYEAWQRAPDAEPPLARLPLGGATDPAAVARCADVERLAARPGARILTAAPAREPLVVAPSRWVLPAPWRASGDQPVVSATAQVPLRIPVAGRWRVWLEASLLGRMTIGVGPQSAGDKRHELAWPGVWQRFGVVDLPAGATAARLRYELGLSAAADQNPLGSLALTPAADDDAAPVLTVAVADYRQLCGKRYDWVEAET